MDEIEHYYQILNLKPGASAKDVKQAYRNLALLWHPDRYPHDSRLQAEAEQKFKEINYAYVNLRSHLNDPQYSVSQRRRPQPTTTPRRPTSADNTHKTHKTNPKNPNTPPTSEFDLETDSSLIPWGWLAGTFLGYTLIGLLLTLLSVPLWNEILALMLWLIVAVSASSGEIFKQSWFIALMVAGAMSGWIIGNQAGGIITGTVWGMIGMVLGAIAGAQVQVKAILWIFTIAEISAITGLVAGSQTGDWLGALFGGMLGAVIGLVMGMISDKAFQGNSRNKSRAGSVLGFGLGACIGSWIGAGEKAVIQAIEKTGLEAIFGAWGAIVVISGVIAQMVSGEKLIESFNELSTFTILATTSGLGLTLGYWLASRG
ncbi:MAG: J domain-containing protein [Cyanobacteriota bacterium]|nr:J domain-containing protein [Cyanobacteriota bacterium]